MTKRNLSAVEQQRLEMEQMMANPEKSLRGTDQILKRPDQNSEKMTIEKLPEILSSVRGSSAGAGSGEFHVYKQARRKSIERRENEDREIREENEAEEFEKKRLETQSKDELRTQKNREKRRKRNKKSRKENDHRREQGPEIPESIRDEQDHQKDAGTNNDEGKEHSRSQSQDNSKSSIKIVEDSF